MGAQPSNHPSTIYLDHCWVCEYKFVRAGGTLLAQEHHLVPKAFGGVDGPTVSLCDGHHTKLHRISQALKTNKPHFDLLVGEDQARRTKLLYLANIVYNAELATRGDPNKAASVVLTLNARQKRMVDDLKKIYPKAKSRNDVFALALEALHKKHFIT